MTYSYISKILSPHLAILVLYMRVHEAERARERARERERERAGQGEGEREGGGERKRGKQQHESATSQGAFGLAEHPHLSELSPHPVGMMSLGGEHFGNHCSCCHEYDKHSLCQKSLATVHSDCAERDL